MGSPQYNITLENTNSIKGIAIIAMLVHHLFYQHPEFGPITYQLGKIGKVCVAMFLFLSGYGLSLQYKKVITNRNSHWIKTTIRFLYKRFIKFYMNYWVIFLIAVPIGIFIYGRSLEIPYGIEKTLPIMLIRDFMGLNGLASYNITWWFNRLILTLYLFFPLLYFLTRNKYLGLLILAVSYRYPNYFPFILGIATASHIEDINKVLRWATPHLLLICTVIALILLCIARQHSPIPYTNGVFLDGIISALISLIIVCISKFGYFDLRLLKILGTHSMNMYMIHSFIYYYFYSQFIYSFKYPILIFSALLIISLSLSLAIESVKRYAGCYQVQQNLISIVD